MNKSKTIGCLPTMFLSVRSVTQTNILVGIRRLLLLRMKNCSVVQFVFFCYESQCEQQLHLENSQTTQS